MSFVFNASAALAKIRSEGELLPTVPIVPTVSPAQAQTVGTIGTVGWVEPQKRTVAPGLDEFEERAAISEFDAGVPRDWAEGFAALQTAQPPQGITKSRWLQIIDDAGRFIDQWGVKAAQLGWTTQEVFGVHPTHPEQRIDHKGLVLLLCGRPVIAITADSATIQAGPNVTQRAFRKAVTDRVPVWELVGHSE